MRKLIFILIILSNNLFASFEMNERMKQSYNYILNLEFDIANQILSIEKENNPHNGIIILHENYIDFLKILIEDNKQYYSNIRKIKNKRINSIKLCDKDSPYFLYCQSEIHLQWAFIYLQNHDYKTAIYSFIKAYYLLIDNQNKHPDFILNKKGLGLIHCFFGSIPAKYKWILNLANLKSGNKLGLAQMNEVLTDPSTELYKDEILFLISFLHIYIIEDVNSCKNYLDKIGDNYSNSILLNFAAVSLSNKLQLNDYSITILENRPNNDKYIFHYMNYLLGLSRLYKLDYKESLKYLNKFISNYRGDNYIKSAYQKLSWIAFLQGNQKKADIYLLDVIENGAIFTSVDKNANFEAINNKFSHPQLLKARLLSDGGYYKQAFLELNLIKDPNLLEQEDEIEYWYRLARITHALNHSERDIINCYQRAYVKGKITNTYFAPMSALQIGLIYESQNNFEQAEFFFDKCLEISDFIFEEGIHQKARSGIVRINN